MSVPPLTRDDLPVDPSRGGQVVPLRPRRDGHGRTLLASPAFCPPTWAADLMARNPALEVTVGVVGTLLDGGVVAGDDPALPVLVDVVGNRAGLAGQLVAGQYRPHVAVDGVAAAWVEVSTTDGGLLVDVAGPGRAEPQFRLLPCGLYEPVAGAADRWRAQLDPRRLAELTVVALQRVPAAGR